MDNLEFQFQDLAAKKYSKCHHHKFLADLLLKITDNKEYWLFTEVSSYLHHGKDYCDCDKIENIFSIDIQKLRNTQSDAEFRRLLYDFLKP